MKKKTIYRVAAIPMLAVLTLALAGCGAFQQEMPGQAAATEPLAQEYTTEPESTEAETTEPETEPETEPGHEHAFTASIVEPDCILGGYTQHVCSCGTVRVDSLKKSWVTTFA